MKNILFISLMLSIGFACQYSGFQDLTPDNGFKPDFAFNVPALNRAISTEDSKQDTGWIVLDTIQDIYTPSPFVRDVQMISTDTFAFQWGDYQIVMKQIHRVANGFDISNSTVDKSYAWLNSSQMYSRKSDYLIPLFNSSGQRYWLQVFKEKVNWYSTYYTARGIWLISEPIEIEGDVS